MSLDDAVRTVLRRWSDFGGRSSRSEYWLFWLALVGLYILASIVAAATRANAVWLVIALAWIVLIVPSLAVFVRRLHDVGRSGWWWLIAIIPFGGLVLLIFTLLDSTPGPNRWGPPPRGSAYADPAHWRQYVYAQPSSWGATTGPQPGWGAPGDPPPGWGTPGWAPPAPAAPTPPPGPVPGPVPAWQEAQRTPPTAAPSPWGQPPAAPPAQTAWTQPQRPIQPPPVPPPPVQPPPVRPPAPPAPAPAAAWSSAATRVCATCGQVAAPGAAYCSRCGSALPTA